MVIHNKYFDHAHPPSEKNTLKTALKNSFKLFVKFFSKTLCKTFAKFPIERPDENAM